jgi:hypothetical protein
MSKQSGLGDRLLVGGYNLSGDIGSIQRVAGGPAALDLTDITQEAYERQGGLRDGGIDFTSWFDKAAGAAHPRLGSLPTTDVTVTYCRGFGLGSSCASCVAKQIGYDGTRAADGSLSFAVATQANGYGLEWGLQLTPGLRTDAAATNGASLDGAASSSFGAQFYLQVTAFTGTSVTVKVQDSADNSAWLDLSGATFTAATGATSQRIAVAGTVRRYLRVVTTGTFSNAVFLVQATRNATAVVF